MSVQLSRILIALCGILGTILLGLYFGVGFSVGLAQLPLDTTAAQVVSIGESIAICGSWVHGFRRPVRFFQSSSSLHSSNELVGQQAWRACLPLLDLLCC